MMRPEAVVENLAALRRVPLFDGLSTEELHSLAERVQRRRYRTGDAVFHKGDPGAALYFILNGLVKIAVPSSQGHEATVALLNHNEFFGELALIDGQPRSATAVAMDTTDTLVLNREDFQAFLDDRPEAANAIMNVLSQRLRHSNDLIADTMFLDVQTRIIKKLLELVHEFGRETDGGIMIDLRLRQQDVASMVGASRESVNRCLTVLEERGLLSLEKQRITLLRPDDLRVWVS